MLEGVMLLWFVLAAAALLFVAVDVRSVLQLSASWRSLTACGRVNGCSPERVP